jgi:competence protein ComEA
MKSRFLLFALAGLLCVGQALARVNVNTATAEELQTLQGIGPVRAQLIIDYRRQNGPFKSIDDLRKIPELRGTVVEGMKGRISYTGPTKVSGAERKRDSAKSDSAAAKPAKLKALPPPAPIAKPVGKASAPAPMSAPHRAGPASPARPAMPGKPANESQPVAAPTPAAVAARPAAPARPAGPAAVRPMVSPAKPAMPGAAPAQPAGAAAKPASPVAKPAAPAMPARPAQPAAH